MRYVTPPDEKNGKVGKRESERDVSSNDVQLVCDALQLNRSNEANGGYINTCKHTHAHAQKKKMKKC